MELIKAVTETSSLIASCRTRQELFDCLTERTCYETESAFSLICAGKGEGTLASLSCSHGGQDDYALNLDGEILRFLGECGDYVLCQGEGRSRFASLFLRPGMNSAVAYPLASGERVTILLILNSPGERGYDGERLTYIDSVCRVASRALGRMK